MSPRRTHGRLGDGGGLSGHVGVVWVKLVGRRQRGGRKTSGTTEEGSANRLPDRCGARPFHHQGVVPTYAWGSLSHAIESATRAGKGEQEEGRTGMLLVALCFRLARLISGRVATPQGVIHRGGLATWATRDSRSLQATRNAEANRRRACMVVVCSAGTADVREVGS